MNTNYYTLEYMAHDMQRDSMREAKSQRLWNKALAAARARKSKA